MRGYSDADRKWLEEEVRKRAARLAPLPRYQDLAGADEPDEGPESRLQGKIQAWAKEWGRPIQSNRKTKGARTLLTPGWPDITLVTTGGKVIFIELKSNRGRLTEDQKQMKLQFMAMGHQIHEVRSYRRFLEIVQ